MQNAVDIMAMVQKNGMLKAKFDVPSKASSNPYSFKNELNDARKISYSNERKGPQVQRDYPGRTAENPTEKFAKVMSGNHAKREVKEPPEVQRDEQTQKAGAADSAKSTEQLTDTREKTAKETVAPEDLKDILQLLQDMLQQMQALANQSSNSQALTENKTALQNVLQKLTGGQALQAGEVSKLLGELQSQLAKLTEQLPAISQGETPSQTERLLAELMQKLKELPQKNQDRIAETARTAVPMTGEKPVTGQSKTEADTAQLKAADVNPKAEEHIAEKEEEAKDDQAKEQSSSSRQNSEKTAAREAGPVNVQNQMKSDFAVPQNSKQNIQVVTKQLDAKLQKENLVPINKSDIINQVVKKADILISDSHQEMMMKLEPESLGKLNLKIVVEKGLITAKFMAESQQVKEVLESSFNQLKDALQEKGIVVQSFSVSVGQQGGGFQSQQGFEQWRRSMKFNNNKANGDYLELEDDTMMSNNPYNYHEGKVDFKA
jgi:flagellar hook-length control protein FliK